AFADALTSDEPRKLPRLSGGETVRLLFAVGKHGNLPAVCTGAFLAGHRPDSDPPERSRRQFKKFVSRIICQRAPADDSANVGASFSDARRDRSFPAQGSRHQLARLHSL